MPERQNCVPCGDKDRLCCVSVDKIFDSARDKDCFEDLRVHVPDFAREIIDRAGAVRCKKVEVINVGISTEPVPFNKGFYQVNVRYYFCPTLECCLGGGCVKEIKGLCAFDKKLILYGSEKNVSVFTSDPNNNGFCFDERDLRCDTEPNMPSVVLEIAEPVCLDCKLVERCRPFGHCCMGVDSIPASVAERFESPFVDGDGVNNVYITLGVFSVIRMERKVQLILPQSRFAVPERESKPSDTGDPCSVFSKMSFPYSEFFPYADVSAERNRASTDAHCPNN